MNNKICVNIKNRKIANDKIYTPKPIALKMIEMCDLNKNDYVLDPSYGEGVFFNNFPEFVKKDFCEIEQGKDFFECNTRYTAVIGNPPYSLWDKWLEHTMKLTDKFCYLFGVLNFTDKRVNKILKNGFGITKIHLLKVSWWFGHQFLIVFEKNKKSILSVEEAIINCDICNKRCLRGLKGNSMNECKIK